MDYRIAALCLCAATQSLAGDRDRLVQHARTYLAVRETTPNRSPDIDRWNRLSGAPLGSPYCAAFVTAMHEEMGIPAVRSAWAPAWFPTAHRVLFSAVESGDVFGIFYPLKGRIAHVGLIQSKRGNFLLTIEANTSPDAAMGSAADRDGQGVYGRRRPISLMGARRNAYSRFW